MKRSATSCPISEIIGNQGKFRDLSREYSELDPVVNLFQRFLIARSDMAGAEEMLEDNDPEIKTMGQEEIPMLKKTHGKSRARIKETAYSCRSS